MLGGVVVLTLSFLLSPLTVQEMLLSTVTVSLQQMSLFN